MVIIVLNEYGTKWNESNKDFSTPKRDTIFNISMIKVGTITLQKAQKYRTKI